VDTPLVGERHGFKKGGRPMKTGEIPKEGGTLKMDTLEKQADRLTEG